MPKFRTQYDLIPDEGEVNSGELVTQPGQSFTTREIYERFLVTGRVESCSRPVVFDSDELGRDPGFDDYDDTQDGAFDLSDATERKDMLSNTSAQRKEINRLSSLYAVGKITFDEFVHLANKQNPDFAAPLIEHFAMQMRQQQQQQNKDE